jgi:hypothetical protein
VYLHSAELVACAEASMDNPCKEISMAAAQNYFPITEGIAVEELS